MILIQELHYKCFVALLEHPFVKVGYNVMDIAPLYHPHPSVLACGFVVTDCVQREWDAQEMSSDAVESEAAEPNDDVKIIRMENTHLESLRGHADTARLKQVATVTSFLSVPKIYGGLVGGDINPIGPLDNHLLEKSVDA
ncbi:hypothetical protein GALMADRAFT_207739 [Galerina marginata CBS 339.88]|uniref:Uncharacterized protein n=1 Tax=Galerina marginata (strain CBS 339.88) TaxID=685588 RepID=A0A067TLG6_GALM3|nr:hypothetical protein GALMADRAFT_207739 [Galerina marginata CBS 339.88]